MLKLVICMTYFKHVEKNHTPRADVFTLHHIHRVTLVIFPATHGFSFGASTFLWSFHASQLLILAAS